MILDSRKRSFFILAAIVVGLCLAVLGVQLTAGKISADEVQQASPAGSPATQISEGGLANCRYGLAAMGADQVGVVDDFGAGVFLDFNYKGTLAASNGAQYIPVIRVVQDKDANGNYLPSYTVTPSIESTDPANPATLAYWLNVHPGALWFVGNEVDRGPDPGQIESSQGDMYPHVYAEAYHDVVQYIRQHDPAAHVAVSGLVQVTPGRMQYLDLVWEAHIEKYGYPMDVDVWNMHIYILPEANTQGGPNGIANIAVGTDPALAKRESGGDPAQCPLTEIYCFAEHDNMNVFAQQVINMRTWMRDHGQRHKPLILSEFSLLYPYENDGGSCFIQDEYGNCFTPERVQTFMSAALQYLQTATNPALGYPLDGNRLVQQWIWFSINHKNLAGSVSNLYNHDENGITTIRPLGTLFANTVNSQPVNVNLVPVQASSPGGETGEGDTANVEIWATFRNNGNTQVVNAFNVTFYADAALTVPIGTAVVLPQVIGCSQIAYRASVAWDNLMPGVHPFWAKIDSTNVVPESNESDNVIRGIVLVDGDSTYLPVSYFQP